MVAPSWRSRSSCWRVSMPSATTCLFSVRPSEMTVRTISTFFGLWSMPITNERSIFRQSNGSVLR